MASRHGVLADGHHGVIDRTRAVFLDRINRINRMAGGEAGHGQNAEIKSAKRAIRLR